MPRKNFVADLQEAMSADPLVATNIFDLQPGSEDGSLWFKYESPGGGSQTVKIEAQVTDVGDYPSAHGFFIYTASENIPRSISEALADFSIFDGMKVSPMLCKVAKVLNKATASSQLHPARPDQDIMDVDSAPEPESEEIDGSEEDDEPMEYDDEEGYSPRPTHYSTSNSTRSNTKSNAECNSRIRADLRATKSAGFRVGYLGNLLNNGQDSFVTISCRISKLGIPDEALQAWHLERKHYIVLLIHYTAGYRTTDRLCAEDLSHSRPPIEMRVGTSRRYKVTATEAVDAFSQIKEENQRKYESGSQDMVDKDKAVNIDGGLQSIFISRPLNELLNQRLLSILRYRLALGLPWSGAEAYYNDNQGRNVNESDTINDRHFSPDRSPLAEHLPQLVTSDHFTNVAGGAEANLSFPLLAMQFTLRHLVQCTEFCLVCHCKVETSFEALKPYVCSRPLCLWQYMALGFGPSIDHEILTQPDVVDLLISFCYSSARSKRLKSLPIGMGLMVPLPSFIKVDHLVDSFAGTDHIKTAPQSNNPPSKPLVAKRYSAKYDESTSELIFPNGVKPLKPGDWIVSTAMGPNRSNQHRRVVETLYPVVRLGPPIPRPSATTSEEQQQVAPIQTQTLNTGTLTNGSLPNANTDLSTHQDMEFVIYDQHFDDLSDMGKFSAICLLLDTLPAVSEMKAYLQSGGGRHISLQQWTDRLSVSALGLLRWIIASNRSCIVQCSNVDDNKVRSEEGVTGMASYVQFRFVQGAPDKEQRFVTAVRETAARLGLKYPTIFAWHGSPLGNWHSIVREGLHFRETANGRAFGNGVYHSLQATTSLSYSGALPLAMAYIDATSFSSWSRSRLRITQALSLNEIVNAPQEFVSKSPHLVVAQLDWIQTRYLFVKSDVPDSKAEEKLPVEIFDQDPTYNPVGPTGQKIVIPVTAVCHSRRPGTRTVKNGNKRSKVATLQKQVDETFLSDQTDIEDVEVLFSDDEETVLQTQKGLETGKCKIHHLPAGKKIFDSPKTDFVPGTLKLVNLPMLNPPSYATPQATKALQRELRATLEIQETHPTHELGWSIDPELVNNVYQWIVEFHSFEKHLPLANDMKEKGLKSIILELRFANSFPYSPPFVRIIRPRFLPFMQGGGGHVTAGGALCMELLTNTGWSSVNNIESVLLQVRMAISSLDPKPARLEKGPVKEYNTFEAIEAYRRACVAHGWEVPADFTSFVSGSVNSFHTSSSQA